MKKTVVCQMTLGRTRVSGYTLYDPESLAFEEFTPLEVKRLIKKEGVNGLILTKDGEIELDEVGFNQRNLPVKSGVGKFRLLKEGKDSSDILLYALTKVADTPEGLVYEIVNNISARLPVKEKLVKALYTLNKLSGCWVNEATGMIRFADGVEFIDMTNDDEDKEEPNGSRNADDTVGNETDAAGTVRDAGDSIFGADGDPADAVTPCAEQEAGIFDRGDTGESAVPLSAEPTVETEPDASVDPAAVILDTLDSLLPTSDDEPAEIVDTLPKLDKVEQFNQGEASDTHDPNTLVSDVPYTVPNTTATTTKLESSNSKKPNNSKKNKQKKSK